MISKAIEIAESEEDVLFLVFIDGSEVCQDHIPLLVFDLELKFKDYSRIHVKPIHFIDDQDNGLIELTKRFSHIMVDEMFDNYANLSKRSQEEIINMTADKSTVWIAISNMHIGIATKSSENPHSDIGRFFPKFEIAEIKTPLRSPRQNV